MSYVTLQEKDHVLLIGLNRPEKMNAFTTGMLRELAAAYTRLEDSASLRCGLLYAEGDHFTAGLDLAEVAPAVRSGAALFPEDMVDPLQLGGRRRTKPVVVAVQGYCLTIAIELILAADIAVADRTARFGQIEVKRGIFPFGGATLRFHQRCGWGNAMRYLLTGDQFDADEALRIGLIQEVVPAAARDRGFEIAATIAAQAPLAVYATLASARQSLEEGTVAAAGSLLSTVRRLMTTDDAAEGLRSFLERRAGRFQGR